MDSDQILGYLDERIAGYQAARRLALHPSEWPPEAQAELAILRELRDYITGTAKCPPIP